MGAMGDLLLLTVDDLKESRVNCCAQPTEDMFMNYSTVRPDINWLYKVALGMVVALFVSACTGQSPSSGNFDECVREGYFKSVEIAGGYYRCVYNSSTKKYTLYRYTCPAGKEFNEATRQCE